MLSLECLRVFKIRFCFVLLSNKALNDWALGEQWIVFPLNLNRGKIDILGENLLLPKGPVIKC